MVPSGATMEKDATDPEGLQGLSLWGHVAAHFNPLQAGGRVSLVLAGSSHLSLQRGGGGYGRGRCKEVRAIWNPRANARGKQRPVSTASKT